MPAWKQGPQQWHHDGARRECVRVCHTDGDGLLSYSLGIELAWYKVEHCNEGVASSTGPFGNGQYLLQPPRSKLSTWSLASWPYLPAPLLLWQG